MSGLAELEREIAELLQAPIPLLEIGPPLAPEAPAPGPAPLAPTPPETAGAPSSSPPASETERLLRSEIVRLRGALETIRRDVADHRAAVAGVSGQLDEVSMVLQEIRSAGPRPAPTPPKGPEPEANPGDSASPRRRTTLSAAPVFFLGPEGRTIEAQAFFTLGKGGALEAFLTQVLQQWESSGYAIETKGSAEGFTLTLLGDPEQRGLRLLPSGMYLMQIGKRELEDLQRLPPLVSSKSWPKNGGFMRR